MKQPDATSAGVTHVTRLTFTHEHRRRLVAEGGLEWCARALDLCDLFVIEAGRRFRASRMALESPQDETRRAVARSVRTVGGFGVPDPILPTLPDGKQE